MIKNYNPLGFWLEMADYLHKDPFSANNIYEVQTPFTLSLRSGQKYSLKKKYTIVFADRITNGPMKISESEVGTSSNLEGDSFFEKAINAGLKMLELYAAHETIINWDEIVGISPGE